MDFEGPVPPHESESVEVPETHCPVHLERVEVMSQFSAPEGMAINEVVELFINAVKFVSSLNQINDQTE